MYVVQVYTAENISQGRFIVLSEAQTLKPKSLTMKKT